MFLLVLSLAVLQLLMQCLQVVGNSFSACSPYVQLSTPLNHTMSWTTSISQTTVSGSRKQGSFYLLHHLDIKHCIYYMLCIPVVLYTHILSVFIVCDILVCTCQTFCQTFWYTVYIESVHSSLADFIVTIKLCLGVSWLVFSLYSARQIQKLAEELDEVC